MSMIKSEHHDESSSDGREVPDHTERAVALPNALRRIPRVVWLALSAITLIANLLAWVYQNPRWNAEQAGVAGEKNTIFFFGGGGRPQKDEKPTAPPPHNRTGLPDNN